MVREPAWYRYDAGKQRLTLTLHVQPNARENGVVGLHGDALKVKIAAPAVDNKANSALVELLGAVLRIPKSAIIIRHGATGRRKVVDIAGGKDLVQKVASLG